MFAAPLYSQQLYDFLPTIVTSRLPYVYVVKAHSQHTIGVEFSSRTVKLGEKRIKLQVCSYHDACPFYLGLSTQLALGHCGPRTIPVRETTHQLDRSFRDESILLDR
jgi:hypothetical protein